MDFGWKQHYQHFESLLRTPLDLVGKLASVSNWKLVTPLTPEEIIKFEAEKKITTSRLK